MTSECFQMIQLRVPSVSLQRAVFPVLYIDRYTRCGSHSCCSKGYTYIIYMIRWWDKQKIWLRATEPISYSDRNPLQRCILYEIIAGLLQSELSPLISEMDRKMASEWACQFLSLHLLRLFYVSCSLYSQLMGSRIGAKKNPRPHLWQKILRRLPRSIFMTERGLMLSTVSNYDACMPVAAEVGDRISVWGA